jgi:hypothetical protein
VLLALGAGERRGEERDGSLLVLLPSSWSSGGRRVHPPRSIVSLQRLGGGELLSNDTIRFIFTILHINKNRYSHNVEKKTLFFKETFLPHA